MTSVTIDMSGKVALVTGGGYGMGRASARRFASLTFPFRTPDDTFCPYSTPLRA